MTQRSKSVLIIVLVIAIVAIGVLAWLSKAGKLKIGANPVLLGSRLNVTGGATISGFITKGGSLNGITEATVNLAYKNKKGDLLWQRSLTPGSNAFYEFQDAPIIAEADQKVIISVIPWPSFNRQNRCVPFDPPNASRELTLEKNKTYSDVNFSFKCTPLLVTISGKVTDDKGSPLGGVLMDVNGVTYGKTGNNADSRKGMYILNNVPIGDLELGLSPGSLRDLSPAGRGAPCETISPVEKTYKWKVQAADEVKEFENKDFVIKCPTVTTTATTTYASAPRPTTPSTTSTTYVLPPRPSTSVTTTTTIVMPPRPR